MSDEDYSVVIRCAVGAVIMDVTNFEQAKVAEDAGACLLWL